MSNTFSECGSFYCCGGCNSTVECLCNNTGKVVTIFTDSGGISGSGFTGLLVWANESSIKLITSLPSAPPYPFQKNCGCSSGCSYNWNRGGCGNCSRFGTAMIIPTCHIVSFVFVEV